MNKRRAPSKTTARPSNHKKRKRSRDSFYARNRKPLVLGTLALLVLALYLVFRGGSNETPNGATAFTGGDFHSLVADPSSPGRIYAGGHEAVAVSDDRGKSWRDVDSLRGADAMSWGFTAGAVLVGGHPGLSMLASGNEKFSQRNDGLPATDLHSLGAGAGVFYAGSPAGLLVSTDGGESWKVRNPKASQSFMGRILVNPDQPEHIVAPDMTSGVVESRDGGRSWRSLGGGLRAVHWISWNPADVTRIVASGAGRAVESRDSGQTWEELDLPAGASMVEVDPNDPRVLYAGVHDGERVSVYLSRDGGGSWQTP